MKMKDKNASFDLVKSKLIRDIALQSWGCSTLNIIESSPPRGLNFGEVVVLDMFFQAYEIQISSNFCWVLAFFSLNDWTIGKRWPFGLSLQLGLCYPRYIVRNSGVIR
jgi:hypothetical protein